jgi:hypothetical protein
VNRQTKQLGVILALVAMVCFGAWPFWKYLYMKSASAALQARTKALVDQNAQLGPAWAIAMQDDVLTQDEAKILVEAAGEKIESEE